MDMNQAGNYRYVGGMPFASQGVAADDGFDICRATLKSPLAGFEGLQAVRSYLESVGRPVAALCGVELRMPQQLEADDFIALNRRYRKILHEWGLILDGACPVARTNVADKRVDVEVCVAGFSFTVLAEARGESGYEDFVVSGVPELPDGATSSDDIVRAGETSSDALREKAATIIDLLRRRAQALGVVWDESAAVHLYSRHDMGGILTREMVASGIHPAGGVAYFDTAPPVAGYELEIDIRRHARSLVVGL